MTPPLAPAARAALSITREAWLEQAIEELRPAFAAAGAALPPFIRCALSFPSRGALSGRQGGVGDARADVLGECWAGAFQAGGVPVIHISPIVDEPIRVLDVLMHELAHAATPGAGHRGPFARLARALGLMGPATATVAGPELREQLGALSHRLGVFPHVGLNVGAAGPVNPRTGAPREGTRMRRVSCRMCGYLVRTTAKWIAVGCPTCPCGAAMVAEA